MYLSRSIVWQGQQAAMVGVIPGDAVMQQKPQGRGYVQLTATEHMPWAQSHDNMPYVVKAHEFHYSRLENLSHQGTYAFKMLRGTGIDGEHDGWVYKNLLASYTHLRDTSQCHWASRFVEFVRSKKA
jgi:cobyrinic acid a,c-diamide synthase